MTRAAPAPLWAPCELSSKPRAALPVPALDSVLSPAWAARLILKDAAQDHLRDLAGPTVGAWAAYWQGAGLSLADLHEACDMLTGAWMNERAQRAHTRAHLRRLAQQHRAPA
ncbi:hypothetical protein [Deinococcus arcticus]|uniref:Uncharacterized protein n=1 Tax=Deinococcus arcticus TaxID=2136176 RepID=A0A2T3WAQ9_9DEIO|nr:hypothetical protein [Deinococcus arcticus]PTA68985.1 hypothetical protein C8263_04080 [Deinococcus arcticus]